MPWQQDGTFLRVNPDYDATPSGELWGQDLSATPSIKIVATRHDYHDQDLGDGIAACLNLDGLNSMRANLSMGGFKITNIGVAVAVTDIPQYGQIAGEIDYSDSTKVLTLNDRNGDPIDTTIIDLTGVGAGVTEISGDGSGTVVLTPDPISGTGTAGLEVLGTGQTYINGIAAITIDNWGRVTQVTQGAFDNDGEPDQSLGIDQGFTNAVKITISKQAGNQTITMQDATSINAGCMGTAQVDALDNSMQLSGDQVSTGVKQFDTINAGAVNVSGSGLTVSFSSATLTGDVIMSFLPTNDPSVQGQLWNDAGTVKVSNG